MRKMLRGKIHRATITGADLHYEGSVTIDSDLLRGAGIIENEAVCIWDVGNGERFETYAIEGQSGSGVLHTRAFVTADECFNAIDIGTVTANTPLNIVGYNAPATNLTTDQAHIDYTASCSTPSRPRRRPGLRRPSAGAP